MTFVTIDLGAQNIHLVKDVGTIPFLLGKLCGWETALVCYRNGEYSYLDTVRRGMGMRFVRKTKSRTLDIALFMLRNAGKIDILNIYHFSGYLIAAHLLYKLFNPKGRTWIKLDYGAGPLAQLKQKSLKNAVKKRLMRKVDFISAESVCIRDGMEALLSREILLVPNGFEAETVRRGAADSPEKENIILTVGRLGTPPKNTELLLEAFAAAAQAIPGWTLVLAGPVEKEFERWRDEFFSRVSREVRERVVFTGAIEDRDALNALYRRAKIFALPSRWEGFPIVTVEALANGCYLLLSDAIPPAPELTGSGQYGAVVRSGDVAAWTAALRRLAPELNGKQPDFFRAIADYAFANFSWEEIVMKLRSVLEKSV